MNSDELRHLSSNEYTFIYKKWYVIDSQLTKSKYNQNNSIKFEIERIKSSICDCSDAFILVTGDITVTADNNADVALKNCASFQHVKQKLMMF